MGRDAKSYPEGELPTLMDKIDEQQPPTPLHPRLQATRAFFAQLTAKDPDLNAMLFLVGVQELGQGTRPFSKEEKQDLMHIGICTILAPKGHWTLTHKDADGWPHFELGTPMPMLALEDQEHYLELALADYLEGQGLI